MRTGRKRYDGTIDGRVRNEPWGIVTSAGREVILPGRRHANPASEGRVRDA
jgi:hypothetical protein